ncbi:MAG: hypothetical protein AAF755_10935 [Pseudomonadota bacterium]
MERDNAARFEFVSGLFWGLLFSMILLGVALFFLVPEEGPAPLDAEGETFLVPELPAQPPLSFG